MPKINREDYKRMEVLRVAPVGTVNVDLPESEETEVKSKQELIEEWESAVEAAEFYGKGKEERLISYMKDFVSDLNQLDEPEVLSQELPVIPKFVADYIDDRKEVGFPIYQAIRIVKENSRFEHSHLREWLWTNKGQETFARAWLDGYTVEEEQKYYAKVKGWGVNGNDGHVYYSGKFPLSLTKSAESVAHTKDEWKNYGVYEDNADFVKVEELEE